jgi:putative membrane protein
MTTFLPNSGQFGWTWVLVRVGWVIWLLILLGVALVLFLLARRGFQEGFHQKHESHAGKAEEILSERYARGEITREQYEQMKQDIRR